MCVIYACERVCLCVRVSICAYVRVLVCMCVCNTKTRNVCQVKIMEYLATQPSSCTCVLVHVTTRSKSNTSHSTWLLGRFLLLDSDIVQ